MTEKENNYELSIYGKSEVSAKCVIDSFKKIKLGFPNLKPDFYNILSDRIKEHGFTDERLKDAVNNVIDNCIYPTPTIAMFIGFDKKIIIYNYSQMLRLNNELNGQAFKLYGKIKINGMSKPMYCAKEDIEKYKLELFTKYLQLWKDF